MTAIIFSDYANQFMLYLPPYIRISLQPVTVCTQVDHPFSMYAIGKPRFRIGVGRSFENHAEGNYKSCPLSIPPSDVLVIISPQFQKGATGH